MLKVFWHFFGSGYFHVVLNFWHSRTQHKYTHRNYKHFAYISRQWSRVIRRHCCNFLLGLIYFKCSACIANCIWWISWPGKVQWVEGRGRGCCCCSTSLERSKMGCVGAEPHTYIHTYVLYWLVFVLGARPLPMRVIIKHCHHLLNTHSLHTRVVPIHSVRMWMLLIFHNAFSSKHLTLVAFDYWIFIFYTLLFLLMMVMVPTFVVVVHVFAIFFVVLWLLSHTHAQNLIENHMPFLYLGISARQLFKTI